MSRDMRPIRVLIVDDHPVVRHGLRSLLAGHPDLEAVGEAGDGAEALSWLAGHEADVILLDIQMKGLGGSKSRAVRIARTRRSRSSSSRPTMMRAICARLWKPE